MDELLSYFNGDELAASVWQGKYALKNEKGEYVEKTPEDMHKRMAKELERIELKYNSPVTKTQLEILSQFGKERYICEPLDFHSIFSYLDKFKFIVPQGSIMSMLGNPYAVGSISNCFVVPPPHDSYAGICYTDQHLAQLMKRRGGVGTNINKLRPSGSYVKNAAGTSTGAVSFMHRYSNTTREVAQNGRRGALMLLISCLHPEVFDFVKVKQDRTKVTGANISVMLTDKFMKAAENDEDFICQFPIDADISDINILVDDWKKEYNKLIDVEISKGNSVRKLQIMVIKARELFDLIVENAWDNAEPGIAFIDRIINYSPEGVYERFRPVASNPCGEQWLNAHDSCRLLAINLLGVVVNPFTDNAYIDYDKLYEISYIQQRLADNIVDLEIEYVDRIIEKIKNDPEPTEIKETELELWKNIKATAKASRRTGCGFTALGDMLAALGLKYDSDEALSVINDVMKVKMRGELDCTIDLAILRGTFEGFSASEEFGIDGMVGGLTYGVNEFYEMLLKEFPEQSYKMAMYGRRNVSWSTVAPTGSVSILTQTTSGLEPLFLPFYMRRKKVNPSDEGVRVDFVDQNGDSWTEYPILHPKFKDWLDISYSSDQVDMFLKNKEALQKAFELSPWYKATANDIDWVQRVKIQGIIQKYTTNAISSTINLPNNVSKEVVAKIYNESWKAGLKGVTIYRDGCRTGVLVAETKPKVETNKFGYTDAVKRPKELEACLHIVKVKGTKYGVVVGMLDGNPYEVFAFIAPDDVATSCGKLIKIKKGQYDFVSDELTLPNLQNAALHAEEQILTRMISGMLRHGMNPWFIIDQINKTPLEIVSFGKALTRVLKTYIKEEEIKNSLKCNDCGSTNVRLQEGCLTCMDCGSSKCG